MSRLHPIVLWLAGVKLAFHLWIIHGYGWFRDEFYYIACGEHLTGASSITRRLWRS